jgi:hypothetical protein
MTTFYKITKTQADSIGIFEFGNSEIFNPFCGEQNDGTYLVDVNLVERLQYNENIQKVDWKQLEIILETSSDPKKPIQFNINNTN